MNEQNFKFISIPLDRDIHNQAKKLAAQQNNVKQEKQVYLNVLAVYAVHSCLKRLGIESNTNDAFSPVQQCLFGVSYLVVTELNLKLLCHPVLPGEETLNIQLEETESFIGCVAVQFAENLSEVQLLGFYPISAPLAPKLWGEQLHNSLRIPIKNLQPFESLIDCIYSIPKSKKALSLGTIVKQAQKMFNNILQPSPELSLAFKSSSETKLPLVKEIDLEDQKVLLIVEINPSDKNPQTRDIQILVESIDESELPQLELSVLDREENCFPLGIESESRNQLKLESFAGRIGSEFKVKINNLKVPESFIIN